MQVNYYFIVNDLCIKSYKNQKYWKTTGNLLPGDRLDFLQIPYTVSRRLMYHCDEIIACADNSDPVYLKKRSGLLNQKIDTCYLTYIMLASQPI